MATRMASGWLAMAITAVTATGCMTESDSSDLGSVGMELQLPAGVTLSTINWTISNSNTGFTRSDSVSDQFGNTAAFLADALPPGAGYSIALNGTSGDKLRGCTSVAGFAITAGVSTPVVMDFECDIPSPSEVTGATATGANLD